MAHMKPPRLPEAPPAVPPEQQLQALLGACPRDKSLNGRRDEAILRLLIDTGTRRPTCSACESPTSISTTAL